MSDKTTIEWCELGEEEERCPHGHPFGHGCQACDAEDEEDADWRS